MNSPEQIRVALRHHNLSAVAKSCELPYMSVWRVIRGDVKRESYETIKKLSDYVDARKAENAA